MSGVRLLPTNIPAEQALLGAILSNKKAFDLCGELAPEHFADPVNAIVFQAVHRRLTAGHSADPVTLKAFLENVGIGDEVPGGSINAYLVSLLSAMVSINSVGEYAEAIMDAALRRGLIDLCGTITEKAYGTTVAAGEARATASAAIADMERLAVSSGGAVAISIRAAIDAAIKQSEAAYRGDKGSAAIPLGIAALDERWGGLFPQALDMLGARSSAGKTALANQIARNIAGSGVPVGFFSLEVGRRDWGMANLASLSGVSVNDLRTGRLDDAKTRQIMVAQRVLEALPIELVDRAGITLDEAVAEMRLLRRRKGCRVFFVDHRNKLGRPPGFERHTKLDWYGHITDTLKRTAKALDVSIVLLVQLSRDMMRRDDPRPCVADIEYAGEQDADSIALLWRPIMHLTEPVRGKLSAEAHANALSKYHADRTELANVAEVIMAKRRFGDPGVAKLRFDGATLSFHDPAVAVADNLDDMLMGRWGM